ncbi:PREDICTED: uncharacterized protein LOC109593102, partial [Amphimedon queenslandica]|uniref:Uncharacterized protein n=2 Tax=Amphimedon queenslandica TaxID=400682 RepID=A0AAN0K3Z5_AMPQE
MIGTNLYEFIPQTPLQFQEGDIFGVYSDRTGGERLVLYEQRESGPTNLRISGSLDSPPSTISETLSTVNNDFPLVTVEINISTQSTITITSSLEMSILITSSMTSLSPNMFSHMLSSSSSFLHKLSTTPLITPTTLPSELSASFLVVGGIIVAVVCIILVCTCLLIIACIIVCVKKRSSKNDTNITVQDNPAYAPTAGFTIGSPTLQDDPAYASISNTR